MKTVYVGLSGGVDSAVAAYLLKQEGHNVVGTFIKGWEPDFLPCTGTEDRLSAMRVAAHLGIPFVTYDLSAEYKQFVVDAFVAEYKAGRTPNPDVLCNRTIKFGEFWKRAKVDGADFIATGHYAQTDGEQLLVSKDPDKDQTYFLWTLTKDDLKHALFPVGMYRKGEVRKIAEKASLPNFARKDSQGLCFLGHVDMHEFLKRFIEPKAGAIFENGVQVGEHEGVGFYTLGQHVSISGGRRLYVVEKDIAQNELTVASDPVPPMAGTTHTLSDLSWVSGTPHSGPLLVQYRYHGQTVGGNVRGSVVTLREPILVANGQSLVFFDTDNKICLGGGVVS